MTPNILPAKFFWTGLERFVLHRLEGLEGLFTLFAGIFVGGHMVSADQDIAEAPVSINREP
jgi:hypothetical protein